MPTKRTNSLDKHNTISNGERPRTQTTYEQGLSSRVHEHIVHRNEIGPTVQ